MDSSTSHTLVTPLPTKCAALSVDVPSTFQQASSSDKISQYYILPDKQEHLDFIVFDVPEGTQPWDPELPHSGESSLLQTIFLVKALRKPSYLEAKVPVPTRLDLDLLDSLLEDYEDKLVVYFLRYGWPMSRSIVSLTNGLAKVHHKGALDFPDAINHYLATEHFNNTLLVPFFTNRFPDRTASSPLNSVPKWDSDEH